MRNESLFFAHGRPLRFFIAGPAVAGFFITGFLIAGLFIVRSIIGFVRRLLGGGLFRQRDLDMVIGAEFGRFVGVFYHLGRVLSRLLFGDGAARARLTLFAPALADVRAGAGFVGVDQN